jgi:hypothetical protein
MSGVSHDFSYVVCCEAGDGEKYYELKPSYHHQYRSNAVFRRWWRSVVRRLFDAPDALTKRARRVIGRSGIKPAEVKYMTTVNRYVHQDPNLRDEGVLRRQRHIIGLQLSWPDFDALLHQGHLRETEIHKAKFAKIDHQLWYIMDLTPFRLIREKMALSGRSVPSLVSNC